MPKANHNDIVKKLTFQNLIFNIILSAIKIITGFFSNSYSLITDGLKSVLGIADSVIYLIGIDIQKSTDEEQIYKKKRKKSVTAVIINIIITLFSVFAAALSFFRIIQTIGYADEMPRIWAIPVIIITIVIKSYMYINTKDISDELKSTELFSLASSYKTDLFISGAVIAGIIGSFLFDFYLESIISLCISVIIFKSAVEAIEKNLADMSEKYAETDTTEKITGIATECNGVIKVKELEAQIFAHRLYVNTKITVDKNLSVKQAYNLAELVDKKIKNSFSEIKNCFIQIVTDYSD